MIIRVFIQARMSSNRFPGKVLAPLRGKPVLLHVIEKARAVVHPSLVTVLTSVEETDSPIVGYCRWLEQSVFRGPLNDVAGRFRQALTSAFPCDYFFRITADSPLIDPDILRRMLLAAKESGWEVDLVTDTLRRSYPVGQSAELVKTSTFLSADPGTLTPYQREHVTAVFYGIQDATDARHPPKGPSPYHIVNIENPAGDESGFSVAVDTVEDLRRLEHSPLWEQRWRVRR